jgi:hypothetical protein
MENKMGYSINEMWNDVKKWCEQREINYSSLNDKDRETIEKEWNEWKTWLMGY